MSLTPIARPFGDSGHKITTASLREQKLHHAPITCLTAYDYAAARVVRVREDWREKMEAFDGIS